MTYLLSLSAQTAVVSTTPYNAPCLPIFHLSEAYERYSKRNGFLYSLGLLPPMPPHFQLIGTPQARDETTRRRSAAAVGKELQVQRRVLHLAPRGAGSADYTSGGVVGAGLILLSNLPDPGSSMLPPAARSSMFFSRRTPYSTMVSRATWMYWNADIQAVRVILNVVSSDSNKCGGRRHGTGVGAASC